MAELYELQAEAIILDYCLKNHYEVNGYAPVNRDNSEGFEVMEDTEDVDLHVEKLRQYLDLVSLEKDDVAELYAFYQGVFWPDFKESKEEMFERIKQQVASDGFYRVRL